MKMTTNKNNKAIIARTPKTERETAKLIIVIILLIII
jgi:hypothetical protein